MASLSIQPFLLDDFSNLWQSFISVIYVLRKNLFISMNPSSLTHHPFMNASPPPSPTPSHPPTFPSAVTKASSLFPTREDTPGRRIVDNYPLPVWSGKKNKKSDLVFLIYIQKGFPWKSHTSSSARLICSIRSGSCSISASQMSWISSDWWSWRMVFCREYPFCQLIVTWVLMMGGKKIISYQIYGKIFPAHSVTVVVDLFWASDVSRRAGFWVISYVFIYLSVLGFSLSCDIIKLYLEML